MDNKKHVQIYTDGACKKNPGPGGYCAILKYKNNEKIIKGGCELTTNNRMELTAVLKALEILKEPCKVDIYSDSKYFIDSIQKGWATSWKNNNWIKSNNKKALNPDLWDSILKYLEIHETSFHWIKGHSGHPENERCDKIAVAESNKYKNI